MRSLIKRIRQKFGFTKELRGFYLSYLLFLLVPLLMGIAAYMISLNISREQTKHSMHTIMHQTIQSIDYYFDTIDDFSFQLYNNILLTQIMSRNNGSYDLNDLVQTINDLPPFNDNQQVIDLYLVCPRSKDILYTSERAFINPRQYYEYCLKFSTLTYAQWCAIVEDPGNYYRLIRGEPSTTNNESGYYNLLYIVPYTDLVNGTNLGQIVYYIKSTAFTGFLKSTRDMGAVRTCIIDGDGNHLISYGVWDNSISTEEMTGDTGALEQLLESGEKAHVFYQKSTQSGLTYVTIVPDKVITLRSRSVLQTMMIGISVLFTLAVVLTIMLMSINRMPLEQAVKHLGQNNDPQDVPKLKQGLWQIDQGIVRIIKNNTLLSRQLSEQKELFKSSFFNRLMHDYISDSQEIDNILNHLEIKLWGRYFCGIYLQIIGVHDSAHNKEMLISQDYQRINILEMLKDREDTFPFFSLVSDKVFALIYMSHDDSRDLLTDTLRDLHKKLKSQFSCEVRLYAGPFVMDLTGMCTSFEYARTRMVETSTAGEIILITGRDAYENRYSYTANDEQKLKNMLASVNRKGIALMLESIYKRNFTGHKMDLIIRQMFYYRLLDTLIQMDPDTRIPFDFTHCEPECFFDKLKDLYHEACGRIHILQEHAKSETVRRIVNYLHQNYMSCDLSLTMLSTHFNMTESYLSLLIKESLGENFSVYLERLRFEKANQLMQDPGLNISEIAYAVGYLNANSFSRAYRRFTGHSPTHYRRGLARFEETRQ